MATSMYTLLLAFALMAILFSFLCSLWESVLLSITPAYAQLQEQEGTVIGAQLNAFKTNIDRPLSAILTLNTIAHTMGAIGVGAKEGVLERHESEFIRNLLRFDTMKAEDVMTPRTAGARLHLFNLVSAPGQVEGC
jgi:CBS domain containing-hemolysin-like protein